MKSSLNKIAERIVADRYEDEANQFLGELLPILLSKYEELFGEEGEVGELKVRVTDEGLPDGKVGAFKLPEGDGDGILIVSPGAFSGEKAPYWFVMAHELIHAVLKNPEDPHDERFDAMAEAMQIPEQYRN